MDQDTWTAIGAVASSVAALAAVVAVIVSTKISARAAKAAETSALKAEETAATARTQTAVAVRSVAVAERAADAAEVSADAGRRSAEAAVESVGVASRQLEMAEDQLRRSEAPIFSKEPATFVFDRNELVVSFEYISSPLQEITLEVRVRVFNVFGKRPGSVQDEWQFVPVVPGWAWPLTIELPAQDFRPDTVRVDTVSRKFLAPGRATGYWADTWQVDVVEQRFPDIEED